MVVEATLPNREPGIDLSAGIYRRQAWRPTGLHGVDSILSGIASRTKLSHGHRARLIAWYEQFVHRSQPFVGWQPLATADLYPTIDNTRSATLRRRSGSREESRQ